MPRLLDIPPEPSLIGVLFMQEHFSTDVVLATNPECANPHDLVPFLEGYLWKHESISGLEALSPSLASLLLILISLLPNSMIGTSGCRFVYVCRNPNDDVVSPWHFLIKLSLRITPSPSLKETFEKFSRGEFYTAVVFGTLC
ncbi:hypothetical protein NC651_012790 [Populus alba x Populus x berolinensis]|nr:hypothetical protein NC651_012790 [Populus alba x Populus x berolinensis]